MVSNVELKRPAGASGNRQMQEGHIEESGDTHTHTHAHTHTHTHTHTHVTH